MIKRLIPAFIAITLFSCEQVETPQNEKQKPSTTIKNHSYGNIDEISTNHLHLELNVDFENKSLAGVARHTMDNKGADKAVFDIKDRKSTRLNSSHVRISYA